MNPVFLKPLQYIIGIIIILGIAYWAGKQLGIAKVKRDNG